MPWGGYSCGQQGLQVGGGGFGEAMAGLAPNSPPRGEEAGMFTPTPHPDSHVSLPGTLLGSSVGSPALPARPLQVAQPPGRLGISMRIVLRGPLGGDCRTRRWTLAACALVSTSLIASCRLTDIIHVKNLIQGLSHSKQAVHPNCNDINDVVVVMSEVMLPLTSRPLLPPPWYTLLPSLLAPA